MGQCFLVSCFLGNLLIPEIVGSFLVESAGDDSNLDGVFAAYEADVTGHTYTLQTADWRVFVEESLAQSVIDTGVLPVVGEPIITLSTCTGDGYDTRWVVQAVMRFE